MDYLWKILSWMIREIFHIKPDELDPTSSSFSVGKTMLFGFVVVLFVSDCLMGFLLFKATEELIALKEHPVMECPGPLPQPVSTSK